MPPGRPRKPSALHVVDGTVRARNQNPYEPKVVLESPPVPKEFNKEERDAWSRFSSSALKLRVLTVDDWAALEQLATAYATAKKLGQFLRDNGTTYITHTKQGDKMYRSRPEVAQHRSKEKQVLNLLARFGLTPSDRSKVHAMPGAAAKPERSVDPDTEFG